MRTVMKVAKSRPFRIGTFVLACIAAYPTAYVLLPRTADGVSVTVVQCATVQPVLNYFDCQGTTVFRRTFTNEAIVSAVHATLDGIHQVTPWLPPDMVCNAGTECAPTQVYRFDLLWHGSVVQSDRASVHGGYPVFWTVSTLGLELPAREGSTTWQDLRRLTGTHVAPNGVP